MENNQPQRKILIAIDGSGSYMSRRAKDNNKTYGENAVTAVSDFMDQLDRNTLCTALLWADENTAGCLAVNSALNQSQRKPLLDAMRLGFSAGTKMAVSLQDVNSRIGTFKGETDVVILSDGDLFDVDDTAKALQQMAMTRPNSRVFIVNSAKDDAYYPDLQTEKLKAALQGTVAQRNVRFIDCPSSKLGAFLSAVANRTTGQYLVQQEKPSSAAQPLVSKCELGRLRKDFAAAQDALQRIEATLSKLDPDFGKSAHKARHGHHHKGAHETGRHHISRSIAPIGNGRR